MIYLETFEHSAEGVSVSAVPWPHTCGLVYSSGFEKTPTVGKTEKPPTAVYPAVTSGNLAKPILGDARRLGTHIYDIPARPLLPGEVHELVVGALEEADGALAKVGGYVELVPALVGHLHLTRLEAQQRLLGGRASINK